MAEKRTLARPYATAIFDIAKKTSSFEKWSLALNTLALIASDYKVQRMLRNYTIPAQKMADFFEVIAKQVLDKEVLNFVKLLSVRRRLNILPEIALMFEEYRATAENKLNVNFISAIPLDDKKAQQLKEILTEQFHKTVQINFQVDPKILGGFVIRVNDKVIDSSINGQLKRLKETIQI